MGVTSWGVQMADMLSSVLISNAWCFLLGSVFGAVAKHEALSSMLSTSTTSQKGVTS